MHDMMNYSVLSLIYSQSSSIKLSLSIDPQILAGCIMQGHSFNIIIWLVTEWEYLHDDDPDASNLFCTSIS